MAVIVRVTGAHGDVREIALQSGGTLAVAAGDRILLVDVVRAEVQVQRRGDDVIVRLANGDTVTFEDLARHLGGDEAPVLTFADGANGDIGELLRVIDEMMQALVLTGPPVVTINKGAGEGYDVTVAPVAAVQVPFGDRVEIREVDGGVVAISVVGDDVVLQLPEGQGFITNTGGTFRADGQPEVDALDGGGHDLAPFSESGDGLSDFDRAVAREARFDVADRDGPRIDATATLGENDALRPVPPITTFSELDGGNGFVIIGGAGFESSGWSVTTAGDVNGDGFDDLIIGAPRASVGGQYQAGATHVVFGGAEWLGGRLELSTLDVANGFRVDGIDGYDHSGFSVSGAGDVNNDGFDDLVIGAIGTDANGEIEAGTSYVVFGGAGGFAATLDLSSLDGTNGFRIDGLSAYDTAGRWVSSAGDVNGDGIDDLIVGAFGADAHGIARAGQTYVVFGRTGDFGTSFDLSRLDGANGFVLNGINAGDVSGVSAASAGDVNGDGIDDLIIAADGADPNGQDRAGQIYVVFGSTDGFAASLELSALDGSNGFVINGIDAGDVSGFPVGSAGDVNGDGFDDVIIGAYGADTGGQDRAGASYVVFGAGSGFAASLELSSLDGSNGFRMSGIDAYDDAGRSVSGAGDINGDGFDDVIIGAAGGDAYGRIDAGEIYVVFGKAGGFAPDLDLSTLDGDDGFVVAGNDAYDGAGRWVGSAGDVNGDGFADLIVGSGPLNPFLEIGIGESYVIFGADFTGAVTHLGGDGDEVIIGTAGADAIVAGRGDDFVDGAGGADVLRGGAGDDVLVVGDTSFRDIDGGAGEDVLRVDGAGIDIDLTGIANNKISGIEVIDITGSGDNRLTLTLQDLFDLSDSSNVLTVRGNLGDVVSTADSGWSAMGSTVLDGTTFAAFTNGNATLFVQDGVALSGIVP